MSARDERKRSPIPELPAAYEDDLDGLDGLEEETKVQRSVPIERAARRLAMKHELVEVAKLAQALRDPPDAFISPAPAVPTSLEIGVAAVQPPRAKPLRAGGGPTAAIRAGARNQLARPAAPATLAGRPRQHPAAQASRRARPEPDRGAQRRRNWLVVIGALIVAVPGGLILGQPLSSPPAPVAPALLPSSLDMPQGAPRPGARREAQPIAPVAEPAARIAVASATGAAERAEPAPTGAAALTAVPAGSMVGAATASATPQSPPTAASPSELSAPPVTSAPPRRHVRVLPPKDPADEIPPTSN